MKPILFNTKMVRAILAGRKSVTRRVVKPQPKYCVMTQAGVLCSETPIEIIDGFVCAKNADVTTWARLPYRPGDILYVRETWAHPSRSEIEHGADPNMYLYKADEPYLPAAWDRWRPSIHMPREAARLFLRVTGVRVEKLRDALPGDIANEGLSLDDVIHRPWVWHDLWDSTIKKADRDRYGWAANPWVWAIEFERVSKEEALNWKD